MTTDPKDAGIARYDLDLMESRMVKDQWGGEWVRHSDHAAEIARLTAALAESEAAAEGALMILVQTQAERDAQIARMREELHEMTRFRDEWRNDFRALEKAIVGDTGLSAMTVAVQARLFRPRAEKAEAERDAALALVARLQHLIREASDPDFLWGAMDNVNDMDADITEFANAASRAIRASIPILAAAEKEASP